jgi:hypothetical protein
VLAINGGCFVSGSTSIKFYSSVFLKKLMAKLRLTPTKRVLRGFKKTRIAERKRGLLLSKSYFDLSPEFSTP